MRRLLTTQEQDGWRELVNKEAFCRVSWKVKYGSKYPRQVPNYGISQKKSFLPAIRPPDDGGNSSPCEEITVQKNEGKKPPEREDDASLQEPLPEMRPPTAETVQLLYQGFSHEGKGRQHYLKERKRKSPEEKFYYPILSSWDYGWRLGDAVKDIRTPIYGKSRIVKDTFYFKNGIFYHPSKTDKLS
ncbi:protein ATP6V1FNB-like [Sceloporus undulatus]|uniref:protein ATP6V1FNB-like n=1 Tax=Sceloporus undulatus TaxID=8520 RepID=UPI001C4DA839|nr:protein ATP6V1FNB-like [Sceloporus undulatus]